METIRSDIKSSTDLEKWLFFSFNLEENEKLLPVMDIRVLKKDEKVGKIELRDRAYYTFGTAKVNHVILDNPSISRMHSVFIADKF